MIGHLLGDLREEFLLVCAERGAHAARLWYARQFLLSMPMLLRASDTLRAGTIVLPLVLLDRMWCLVYSMIPMKDGLDRAPGFLAANILCACLCSLLSGSNTLTAAISTAIAMALSVSAAPPLYVVLALVSVTATSHISGRLRRLQ